MRFLHCSDVHITQDYKKADWRTLGWRRWIALIELSLGGRAAAFRDAVPTLSLIVNRMAAEQADHLIVSGDLTAYGMDAEFFEVAQVLGPLSRQPQGCSVIPGNHDRYSPETLKEHVFERHFKDLLHSDLPGHRSDDGFPFVRLLGEEAAVIGLCSARVPAFPGLSMGWIGKAQFEGLDDILSSPQLKDRATLVAVHHAPFNHRGTNDKWAHGLVDAQALLKRLPGPQYAVLHGHIHRRYHHPATSLRPHIFGAGSSTQHGQEGYWLIDVSNGKISGSEMRSV